MWRQEGKSEVNNKSSPKLYYLYRRHCWEDSPGLSSGYTQDLEVPKTQGYKITLLHQLWDLSHLLSPMKLALTPNQSDYTGLYCQTVGGQWN